MTTNNLINATQALILDICIKYQINPLNFRVIETGEPIDLHDLCDQVYDHFTCNNTNYVAIYFNRDEPTISIETANSHQELLNDYQFDPNEPTDGILEPIEVTIDGTNYTFELITDI